MESSHRRASPPVAIDEARKLARHAEGPSVPARVLPEVMQRGEINTRLCLPSDYTQAVSGRIPALLRRT